jgi:hypothetical protein
VVVPQSDHARFSAAIALAWGNDRFPRPPLPFARFVQGVALHDRGYGEHDDDPIFGTDRERWLELQRDSFRPRGDDPVVDLVVALHVRRLVGDDPLGGEMDAQLGPLHAAAGISPDDARAADAITRLCDAIAFDFALEEPDQGAAAGVTYTVDGLGGITLDPWPLAVPRLLGLVTAFAADGYPTRLEPVAISFEIVPAGA